VKAQGSIAMTTPLRPNHPRAGDIVIYQRDASAGTYLLSAFQHASQLTFHTYDDAIRDATTFATRNHVDAWYTIDGEAYQQMAHHRRERRVVNKLD
jgi:hypothetical protein